jgi:hypothetical protein
MSRKFFVGGNFKMNPNSVAEKKALIELLNQAHIDPSVGKWWRERSTRLGLISGILRSQK